MTRELAIPLGERTATKWRVTVETDMANEDRASRRFRGSCQSYKKIIKAQNH